MAGPARPSWAPEVDAHFGVTKTTVYRPCKEGRVPCLKIGRF